MEAHSAVPIHCIWYRLVIVMYLASIDRHIHTWETYIPQMYFIYLYFSSIKKINKKSNFKWKCSSNVCLYRNVGYVYKYICVSSVDVKYGLKSRILFDEIEKVKAMGVSDKAFDTTIAADHSSHSIHLEEDGINFSIIIMEFCGASLSLLISIDPTQLNHANNGLLSEQCLHCVLLCLSVCVCATPRNNKKRILTPSNKKHENKNQIIKDSWIWQAQN